MPSPPDTTEPAMRLHRFELELCQRLHVIAIRAVHLQRLITGGVECLDARGRLIATVPPGARLVDEAAPQPNPESPTP